VTSTDGQLKSDSVVGGVNVCHPLCLGGVAFPELGVVDRAEIVGVSVDCGRRLPHVGEAGECPLLAKVPLIVRRGVREDDEVLLVVEVRPLDEPDASAV